MKRFYKSVTLSVDDDGGSFLLLDGKPVQTPARQPLKMRVLKLSEAVAEEWAAQKEEILPETMPLSQMAMTLIDRVVPNRTLLEVEVLDYLDTDLVCYRAEEPEIYRQAQEECWNPFVDWFSTAYGLQLLTTSGLSPLSQSQDVHQKIVTTVESLSDELFMVLYLATLGSGSLVMALGFVSGAFSAEAVLGAAFAEETLKDKIYLGEIYGSAPDQERRYKILKTELETLQNFMRLL